MEEWSETIERVLSKSPDLETWSGHFRHRIEELKQVREFWPQRKIRNALEIGCGNGLAAIFFSNAAEKIIASDLPSIDHQAHSIGLESAKEFCTRMQVKNVEVLGCSAENIPLSDKTFDLVYGIYCLEHIPDRERALKEVRRVLIDDGEVLLTVPGFFWALFYPYDFYCGLIFRIVKRALAKFRKNPSSGPASPAPAKVVGVASFRHFYPNFPFPEPHGTHSSWPAELKYYRVSNWQQLLRACGFVNVSLEPIAFLPSHLLNILPKKLSAALESWLRKQKALQGWAQFYCIRGKKPSGA